MQVKKTFNYINDGGENVKISWGLFLLGGGDLTRSDFDHLNFFQSLKQHSVHIDHHLKSYLA